MAELWAGEMRSIHVAERRVLLINLHGSVHAYVDRCPHLGVALSGGSLVDGIVTCPGHGYQFSAATGGGVNPRNCALTALPVQVEAGSILLDLDFAARGES